MKNILKGTRVYLAGNIQYGCQLHNSSWREEFKQKVDHLGIRCLDPRKKMFKTFTEEDPNWVATMKILLERGEYEDVHRQAKEVRRRDLAAIDRSDFLVIKYKADVPTIGTIEEIVTASRANKPMFLIIDGGIKNMPIWLCAIFKHSSWIYESIDEVIETLEKINSGEQEISNEYWRILEDDLN
jgi:hypothetical protein